MELEQGPAPVAESRLRVQEILAVVLVLVGLPLLGLGYVAGLVLLWASDRWTLRDKLAGTLLWPGGLGAVLIALLVLGTFATPAALEECDASGTCVQIGGASPAVGAWVGLAVLVVAAVVPVLTSIHLLRSARVPPRR